MKLEKYPIKAEFSDRELLVFVYRELGIRGSIYKKKIDLKEREKWIIKYDQFVEVFNRMRKTVPTAKRDLSILGRRPQKSDINALLGYVKEEIRKRERFYPAWILNKRMKRAEAKVELLGMKAVFNKLLDDKLENEGRQSSLFSDQNQK